LPTEVPPTAELTPIAPLPPSGEPAPPPPPVSATANTEAMPTGGGLRVTFGPTDAELNPDSVTSIRQFTGTGKSGDTTYNVLAYAAGSANDPSAARRLSLSRALAVRSALMADGVSSSRIFVRALGSAGGNGPADRVDINRLGGNSASARTP
jgi:outer membrane protein OmpA-like peptidoglycan-associated protein